MAWAGYMCGGRFNKLSVQVWNSQEIYQPSMFILRHADSSFPAPFSTWNALALSRSPKGWLCTGAFTFQMSLHGVDSRTELSCV